jgi:uncharacterized protein
VTGVIGIVTAVSSRNSLFYLQDPTGNGDDTTSDAIVVYTGTTTSTVVSVGDKVSVTGTVTEYTPGNASNRNLSTTQITTTASGGSVTILSSNNALPSPILIGGSGTDGRIPPTESMADAVTFFEALEAMRVTLVSPVCVAGSNGFGELFAVVDNGTNATGRSIRGTLNISPSDFNPERVQIDTTDTTLSKSVVAPMVDAGAVLSDVTGVLG